MSAHKDAIALTQEQNGGSPHQYEEKEIDEPGVVPARYRGTAHDKKEMSVMGKQQVLRVGTMVPNIMSHSDSSSGISSL